MISTLLCPQRHWESARQLVSNTVRYDLRMFGSAQSMFAVRGTSDIDLCWVDPAVKKTREKDVLYRCAALLERQATQFHNIQRIVFARVPIIKGGVHVSDGAAVEFDICVNNTLALHNTDLLRTYARLDDRLVRGCCCRVAFPVSVGQRRGGLLDALRTCTQSAPVSVPGETLGEATRDQHSP